MVRLPLTLRALMLVPLLALAVDHARATLACGPRAESCLEAAGQGWLGSAGPVLLVLYAAALAVAVARLAGGAGTVATGTPPGFLRLWLIGSAGVAAVCCGQALLAGALDGAALGGGWPELAAFCTLAGAVLALALRAAPAAAAFARSLRPDAPRLLLAGAPAHLVAAQPERRARLRFALATPGRGPPAPVA